MDEKKVLLCVTGGIAAFKSAALTSKLVQAGYSVRVILSENAQKFVTPLTFQALAGNEVYVDAFREGNSRIIAHIDLADWPDLILVAPATANIIGKLSAGIADDLISTTLLATEKPIWIAPGMNVHMYHHPAVQRNLENLKADGCFILEPKEGYLACGYTGKGRMEEPERILERINQYFLSNRRRFLSGKRILVTAGPTRERIDPVRFLSNYSSGKMGYRLAEVARDLGGEVVLVSGPVSEEPPKGVQLIRVEGTDEMYKAVLDRFDGADIVIKAAAVADYRPVEELPEKMKKSNDDIVLRLTRTKDILAELGKRKRGQILVGFAAETDHVEEYARKKLFEKNADMIVANDISLEGSGFGADTNIVTLYKKGENPIRLPKMSKREVALAIFGEIEKMMGSTSE
jgi:Phosphopantothenate-cysteine ligase (EC 6.3.2.5)/Phosphopantothenoylcysteine decarboxylase (EC 4.1.1.36)